jgi:hypothetical protein
VRKILLALCVLLLTSPAWAAEPIIQGDAQFVYSQEIDGVVNPEIESVYKYTSVISASPAITLEGLDAIFPSRLDGMAFSVLYTHETGKSGIHPGTFIFQFTKDDILDFPNGAAIMDEIEGSGAPIDVLFKYFDPVFVIYGPDGEKISVNIKNFSFDFEFITGDYNIMALSFPVVLADGYPDTFCIEYVSEYPVVYDAMVSETNAGVSGDGNIEVAFALVPNEKATDVARYDFPILEPNGEKGYVIFDDPSEYLDIPEMSDVSAAIIASGETSFTDTENGFSFETSTESEKNAAFVHFAVHSDDSGTLAVNGYPLDTDEILLPDGTRYLTADFVLVNKLFGVGILVSEKDGKKTVFVFDGATDDVLAASVEVVPEPSLDALFYHERGSFEASYLEGLPDQTENVSGTFSSATLPLLDNMTEQVAPVNFEATIDAGSSVFGIYEFSFFGDDVPDIDTYLLQEDVYYVFDFVRPILSVGDITFDVYEFLEANGRPDLISVSGSLQTGLSIKVPVVFSDNVPFEVSIEGNYLLISDGNEDGVLSIGSYIGVLGEIVEPSIDELFYHDHGSFEVLSQAELENQTEAVSVVFSDAELPLLEDMTEQIAPVELMADIDTGSAVFGWYEFSLFGDDVPDIDADAIREDINNIFDYVRPVLSVDGITFDVYDYLATNERTELISISGSLQTGFSIKVPILFLDKAPRAISLEDDYLGSYLHISDGNEDGVLNIGLYIGIMERASEIEEALLLSTPEISLKKADLQIGLQEADAVFELAEAALWPGKAGVSAATHIVSFTGTYGGEGKYVPLDVTLSVAVETLQALSRKGYDDMLDAWGENPFALFDHFHIYKQVGDFVYDLVIMGGKEAFVLSGDPTTKINISFTVVLIDDIGFVSFDDSLSAFIIYDGERDSELTDPLFIGALVPDKPEGGVERPVLNAPSVSLKLANIDASSLGLEEAEADFEYLGLTDWPGKEGVLDAVSVGSFEGEYDGTGKYVPLRMEVSVTSYDLGRLSKDRHAKVISKWTEDRTAFLDYFHVYKQVGDLVYDLVMLGGKEAFTVSGDPTTRVTVSFPAILIDDAGNTYCDEDLGFVIYDGNPDGKLVDPLFVGTPEQVPVDEGEDDEEGDEELKHILPDNPEGPSTGHSDMDKWFKIFSLF